jgi:hypothetical protein
MNPFTTNTRERDARNQPTPEEKERHWGELLGKDSDPNPHQVPFDLKSIVVATNATITYRETTYRFTIIPAGTFQTEPNSQPEPNRFKITNVTDDPIDMTNSKETFLKDIVKHKVPIVLTVDKMKPENIIISPDTITSYSSPTMFDRTYVFKLVSGGGGGGGGAAASEGGGGGAADVGSKRGGKSVRRRSRKRYSRRRRVSNKKYSASRRGRGRGRRSRKN